LPVNPCLPEAKLSHLDVEAAWRRLQHVLPATPLHHCQRRDAFLKLENLQATGAYKVRGAFNALAVQVARGDRRPVIAASAGNHAQGVAWAARHFGLAAAVVVPCGAPRTKLDGAERLGARVIEVEGDFERCVERARQLAEAHDWRFVHAFEDADVIAGQGTVALELGGHPVDVVVVPIGGGGLAAGVSLWCRARGIRVVGAQVVGVDAMYRRLARKAPCALAATVADGLVVRQPGRLTTAICRSSLECIVHVSEREVEAAMAELADRDKLVVEGAGAVAVAALRYVRGRCRVAVVSGGNVDLAELARLTPRSSPRPQPAARPDGAAS